MSIGIVSDDELNQELERVNGKKSTNVDVEIVDKPTRGRDNGDVNVPDSLRKIIGETSVIEGRQEALELARMFDVSPSSVSAYANGATSTTKYNEPKSSILSHIRRSKERAIRKASNRLNIALEGITPEKLEEIKPRELAGIARDMSAIIKNLEPQDNMPTEGENKTPQFVIFAPQFVKEEKFETIVVNE